MLGGRGWNRTTNLSIKSRRLSSCLYLPPLNISCFFISFMAQLGPINLPPCDITYHGRGAHKGGTILALCIHGRLIDGPGLDGR